MLGSVGSVYIMSYGIVYLKFDMLGVHRRLMKIAVHQSRFVHHHFTLQSAAASVSFGAREGALATF